MKLLTILFGLVILLGSPAFAAGKKATDVDDIKFVSLNNHVVIENGVIRLGDVFQGTGEYAERVIAYSPRPGSRSVFDARWLKRVALAFKLNWRPASAAERIVIERDSQIITKSEIETILHERLVAEGGDANARVVLANRSFRLHLPVGENYLLGIEQINFDNANGRFSAIMAWGNGKDERRRVTGRLERMTEVPVLTKRIMRGDIIRAGDVEWLELPQARLSRNAVTDLDRLVGMAAKRGISVGKPISESDIRRPLSVSKGDSVTMVLSTPIMRLTTKGKALESGANGDTIRITNSQTRTVVEAVITGPGQARVDAPVNLAMR
ncbi:MAG: flagellar basal body P-ring formation chaperone FlgA [Magnetovibrio sp.]|nr:flagellar basal body P-ring formation chaperone FlgA [Magnetovibrio sp.]